MVQITTPSIPLTHFYMLAGYGPPMNPDLMSWGGRLGFNLRLRCLHLTEPGDVSPLNGVPRAVQRMSHLQGKCPGGALECYSKKRIVWHP